MNKTIMSDFHGDEPEIDASRLLEANEDLAYERMKHQRCETNASRFLDKVLANEILKGVL